MSKVIDHPLNKENSVSLTPPELEPLYSVADLQKWSRASESFWRKEISRGKLRVVKLGAAITRIPKSALDEYLRERDRRTTAAEA